MPSSALVGLTICMQALCCSSRSPQPLHKHGFERFELFVARNSYRSNMSLKMRPEYPIWRTVDQSKRNFLAFQARCYAR